MNPFRLARNVGSLQRLRRVVAVLTQHGFGHAVDRMNLRRFSPLRRWRGTPSEEQLAPMSIGRRLAAVCTDLGPTFIKLGQMATTRPDMFPAEILAELETLQDRVTPFDSQAARRIIEEELGAPVGELFRSLADEPTASGSIGQVHRACTKDGAEVVVKVKRPDIDRVVRQDLFLLKRLAEAMESFLPELRGYRPVMLIEEFEQALTRELDFTHEASATNRLRLALADEPHLHIPRTYWELSTSRVLTLEAVDGRNVGQVLQAGAQGFDRRQLASRLARLYVRQFFQIGTFHADPHPGNILVSPPANIALIDFGQTGVVSDELAGQFVAILAATIYRDTEFLVGVLADMGALGSETDTRQLSRELRILQDKYYGLPMGRIDLVTVFHEATAVMRRHDVSIPRDLVLVLKTLSAAMGIVMQLDPQFDIVGVLRPQLKELIKERFAPWRMARTLGTASWYSLGLFRDAPRQLRAALRHLASGQWQINVRHERLDQLTRELDRSSNRLSFSVVIAAIIVGSSMVISTDTEVAILGIPLRWFGVVGYVCAAVLGAGLLWAIFRSGRLS